MNRSFKIIGRHPFNGRQQKKRVYTSSKDYMKFKDELTARYRTYLVVEHYELIDGEWDLIFTGNYNGESGWRSGYKH